MALIVDSREKPTADAKKTSALLDMALRELKAFELKYSTLSQLAPVFEAIKEVRDK